MLIKDQISLTQGFRSGDLVSLVSAFLISGYLITSKMLRQKIASTIFTSSLYFITSLYFLAWGTYQGVDFINYPASTWYAIAGLILIPTLLGHNLFSYLLGHMNINILSCGKLLEPIVASVAAYFLFAESIYESTALAFLLTSSAVVLLFLPQKTKDT